MAQEQTALVGEPIEVLVNVIGSAGTHEAATIDTTTTRIEGYPATAPTVTTIATGIYKISFSGVTPAPAEGDRLTVKVNGTVTSTSTAWSEYGIPVKILANDVSSFDASTDTVANVTTTGSVSGNVAGSVGSVAGNVLGSVASVVGNVGGNVVGSVASVVGNVGGSVDSVVNAVGSVTGNVGGSVASVVGNVGGSVDSVTNAVGSVTGNVGGSVASVVGNVGGNVVGSVGSVSGNVTGSVASVSGNVAGSVGSVVAAVETDTASRTASKATLSDLAGVALSSEIAALNDLSSSDVENAVWDASLASHNVAGSTGKAVKQLKEGVISQDGSINDTSATTTSFVTNLTNATDGFYHDKMIVFTSGSLNGQARHIEDYNGTTKQITVSQAFSFAPSNGDNFLLLAVHEFSLEEMATTIWETQQSGFTTSGSFGYYLDSQVSTSGGGGSVTVSDITQTALAKFVNTDTGETAAASGSVAELSQGSAGGDVTVGSFTQTALAEFANTDTGETSVVGGSVASLSGGYVINSAQSVAASDVRSGVPIGGSSVGTLVVPSEVDVETGVQYGAAGTEFTGSLSSLPTIDSLPVTNNANVKNIIAGNTYRVGFGDVPEWNWLGGAFPAYAAGATAKIVFSLRNRPSDRSELDLTIDASGSPVVLKLELTPDQSKEIVSGQYRYDVEIVWSNGDTKTMTFGDLFVYEPYSLTT